LTPSQVRYRAALRSEPAKPLTTPGCLRKYYFLLQLRSQHNQPVPVKVAHRALPGGLLLGAQSLASGALENQVTGRARTNGGRIAPPFANHNYMPVVFFSPMSGRPPDTAAKSIFADAVIVPGPSQNSAPCGMTVIR